MVVAGGGIVGEFTEVEVGEVEDADLGILGHNITADNIPLNIR